MGKIAFILICILTQYGCFSRYSDNSYTQNLLKAITCQLTLSDSKALFANIGFVGNYAAKGEFFPRSEAGSLKISILKHPLSLSGAEATHFLYSQRDFEGIGFPGIVYGQFNGNANQTIKDLNFVADKPDNRRFLKLVSQNGSCSIALYLQKTAEDSFLLGCGYCPP